MRVEIVVAGDPAPQGSKRFAGMFKGRGLLVEDSKRVKPWRHKVVRAIDEYLLNLPAEERAKFPLDVPVRCRMIFTMARPKKPKFKDFPGVAPDVSKLCRSTEDAIANTRPKKNELKARLLTDDSRIVGYSRLDKVYPRAEYNISAGDDLEALPWPGVRIVLETI